MLGKLLKQDFRATARVMLPVCLIALILAAFTRGCAALTKSAAATAPWRLQNADFLSFVTNVLGVLFVISLIAVLVLAFILMVWRFYRSFLTDEGYLMFTLPVTTAKLVLSKLIVALVWFVVSIAVVVLSCVIVGADSRVIEVFYNVEGSAPWSGGQLRAVLLSIFAFALIHETTFCLQCYASMAIGQSHRRQKELMSVVFFFVFYIAIQILSSIGLLTIMGMNPGVYVEKLVTPDAVYRFVQTILWSFAGVSALIAVIFYGITHRMLKRKLNLQ